MASFNANFQLIKDWARYLGVSETPTEENLGRVVNQGLENLVGMLNHEKPLATQIHFDKEEGFTPKLETALNSKIASASRKLRANAALNKAGMGWDLREELQGNPTVPQLLKDNPGEFPKLLQAGPKIILAVKELKEGGHFELAPVAPPVQTVQEEAAPVETVKEETAPVEVAKEETAPVEVVKEDVVLELSDQESVIEFQNFLEGVQASGAVKDMPPPDAVRDGSWEEASSTSLQHLLRATKFELRVHGKYDGAIDGTFNLSIMANLAKGIKDLDQKDKDALTDKLNLGSGDDGQSLEDTMGRYFDTAIMLSDQGLLHHNKNGQDIKLKKETETFLNIVLALPDDTKNWLADFIEDSGAIGALIATVFKAFFGVSIMKLLGRDEGSDPALDIRQELNDAYKFALDEFADGNGVTLKQEVMSKLKLFNQTIGGLVPGYNPKELEEALDGALDAAEAAEAKVPGSGGAAFSGYLVENVQALKNYAADMRAAEANAPQADGGAPNPGVQTAPPVSLPDSVVSNNGKIEQATLLAQVSGTVMSDANPPASTEPAQPSTTVTEEFTAVGGGTDFVLAQRALEAAIEAKFNEVPLYFEDGDGYNHDVNNADLVLFHEEADSSQEPSMYVWKENGEIKQSLTMPPGMGAPAKVQVEKGFLDINHYRSMPEQIAEGQSSATLVEEQKTKVDDTTPPALAQGAAEATPQAGDPSVVAPTPDDMKYGGKRLNIQVTNHDIHNKDRSKNNNDYFQNLPRIMTTSAHDKLAFQYATGFNPDTALKLGSKGHSPGYSIGSKDTAVIGVTPMTAGIINHHAKLHPVMGLKPDDIILAKQVRDGTTGRARMEFRIANQKDIFEGNFGDFKIKSNDADGFNDFVHSSGFDNLTHTPFTKIKVMDMVQVENKNLHTGELEKKVILPHTPKTFTTYDGFRDANAQPIKIGEKDEHGKTEAQYLNDAVQAYQREHRDANKLVHHGNRNMADWETEPGCSGKFNIRANGRICMPGDPDFGENANDVTGKGFFKSLLPWNWGNDEPDATPQQVKPAA
ncbi:MAG: hypothetical protein DHS20C02_12420 [Micavibrio sp.]|nr:MAG: hypothetical protein DHS20C02_12420 [Micavibrio sp.]